VSDFPAENHSGWLAQFLYGTLPTIQKMQKYLIILFLISFSCKGQSDENIPAQKPESEIIENSKFKLLKAKKQNGLLILFPCFPCDAENTLSDFNIEEIATKSGFSVLAMNLNQRLFLTQEEKELLSEQLSGIVQRQDLPKQNIFIGGFSSGGNVSLLISDYLVKKKSLIKPKGIFVVDSPVDLFGLYKTSIKNMEMKISEASVQESKWIKESFDKEFGDSQNGLKNYEKHSPFTFETQNIENLKSLRGLKIRFYTEPDLKWWKENRQNDYEDLNAFYLQKLSDQLKSEFGDKNIELIKTETRGFRANGDRHPHSWTIVNEKDLIDWMLEE